MLFSATKWRRSMEVSIIRGRGDGVSLERGGSNIASKKTPSFGEGYVSAKDVAWKNREKSLIMTGKPGHEAIEKEDISKKKVH